MDPSDVAMVYGTIVALIFFFIVCTVIVFYRIRNECNKEGYSKLNYVDLDDKP